MDGDFDRPHCPQHTDYVIDAFLQVHAAIYSDGPALLEESNLQAML